MKLPIFSAVILVSAVTAVAQTSTGTTLAPGTTLPIQFERSIDSSRVHAGDVVAAKTTQQVRLSDGQVLPAGAHVTGHVVAAQGFTYDKTPYAKQSTSTLQIHFDTIESKGRTMPLRVYVRAMADPLTTWDAVRPKASDMDSLGATTQIGGDQVVPSQSEVTSPEGDVVAYQKRGGIYAHLISSGSCEAGDTEQSMGLFSASACGLYGYTDVAMLENGKNGEPSTLALAARRRSAKIWAKSAALLEVVGDNSGNTAR